MATAASSNVLHVSSSDGRSMAETWLHARAIMWLQQALEDYFHGRNDVFIASDIVWYWQEGNPSASISPDVMVVSGVRTRDSRERRNYLSWEEDSVVPSAVFEVVSQGTWRVDIDEKLERYEQLGVRELFFFDPEAVYLVPSLQGNRLSGSSYRRQRTDDLSSELGFGMRAEGSVLRLFDLRTGHPVPTRAEAVEAERDRADTEKLRADALESEVERLRALLQKHGHSCGSGA